MRVGFDLDGVIVEYSIAKWLLVDGIKDKERRELIYFFLTSNCKLKSHPSEFLHKDDEYVIITGRAKRWRKTTKEWLKRHGINTSTLFMCNVGLPRDYSSIGVFFDAMAGAKARYIKSECLDIYFEDSPVLVEKLRKLCPKVRIIQIGGRLK